MAGSPTVSRPKVPSPFDMERIDISDRFRPLQQYNFPASASRAYGEGDYAPGSDSYMGPIKVTGLQGDVAARFLGMPQGLSTAIGPTGLGPFVALGSALSLNKLRRIQKNQQDGKAGNAVGMLNGRIIGVSRGLFGGYVLSGNIPENITDDQRRQIINQLLDLNPTTELVGGKVPTQDDPNPPPPTATPDVVDKILSGVDPEAAGFEAGFGTQAGYNIATDTSFDFEDRKGARPPLDTSVKDFFTNKRFKRTEPFTDAEIERGVEGVMSNLGISPTTPTAFGPGPTSFSQGSPQPPVDMPSANPMTDLLVGEPGASDSDDDSLEDLASAAKSNIVYTSGGKPVTVASSGKFVTTGSGQYVSQADLQQQNLAKQILDSQSDDSDDGNNNTGTQYSFSDLVPDEDDDFIDDNEIGVDDSDTEPGDSGCCFIMLEARYGDGTMDEVVRRYRDEHMTVRNKRGYYKVAEVLVPLMRKSRLAKWLVIKTFADPLVSYGKYYYGQNKHGVIFAPVKSFWMSVFNIVGGDTEFIRENGKVV